MHIVFALLAVCCTAAGAIPAASQKQERILGGSETTINYYPNMVSLLLTNDYVQWRHNCGGSILNQRNILSAAHCLDRFEHQPSRYRARLGSTYASSGGVVLYFTFFILHHNWNDRTMDNDIGIMRTAYSIPYSNVIQPSLIAGANYILRDNEPVWATGWGLITPTGPASEQLRHVQIYTINQDICRQRYAPNLVITSNMLCSGVLDFGGRDQCQMDSGGPLYHNGIVVGVCSFGRGCGDPRYPGVNVRVTRYTEWIQRNS